MRGAPRPHWSSWKLQDPHYAPPAPSTAPPSTQRRPPVCSQTESLSGVSRGWGGGGPEHWPRRVLERSLRGEDPGVSSSAPSDNVIAPSDNVIAPKALPTTNPQASRLGVGERSRSHDLECGGRKLGLEAATGPVDPARAVESGNEQLLGPARPPLQDQRVRLRSEREAAPKGGGSWKLEA